MPRQPNVTQDPLLAGFGMRLRSLRERCGISQEAFAIEAGLDRTYISGIERGTRNIGVLNVYRIASALRVHPSELFRGEADTVSTPTTRQEVERNKKKGQAAR